VTVFLARRLGQTLITLLVLTLMVFALARLTGDPAPLVLPTEATARDLDFFRQQYGLDRPLPHQYAVFLSNILRADFGMSFRYREPAIGIVLAGLGPTLRLTGLAMLLAVAIGLTLGIAAAVLRNRWVDRAVNLYASFGQAVPSFWLGLMLIILFSITLPWLPSSGHGTAAHYVLPVVTLSIFASASITRLTRANMADVMQSDFIHMERLQGLPESRIVLRHALRNASLPIVTYLGLQFGLLIGGAIVTERVFAWPGLGQIIVDAILHRDYPVIQATVLVTAVLFMLVNLAVDVLCMMLDPRLRA
jgi:ABC-type dipeptide/oligopeptide/nickel transport system permease component